MSVSNLKIAGANTIIYRPDGATGDLPAFIFFPGSVESGTDASKLYINGPLHFIQTGWKPNFIVIGVQTPVTYGPDSTKAPTYVQSVLDELLNGKYGIDKNKWFLTGLSYGCAYLMQYLQKQPDAGFHKPAGAIPMSMQIYGLGGSYDTSKLQGNDFRFETIPMWGFCGTQDNFFTPMSRYFSQLKAAGYVTKFTSYPAGHTGWNKYYDPSYVENGQNIYDWSLANANAGAVIVGPPVVTDPVPIAKTIKAVVLNYSDGTSDTFPK